MSQKMKVEYRGRQRFPAKLLSVSIALLFVVFGCGGGGSSGSSTGGGNSYTGRTTPAVIDSSNAQEVASEAYAGAQDSESLNPFSSLQATETSSDSGRPIAIDLYDMFGDALIKADITAQSDAGIASVQTGSDTLPDDCGGSGNASYTISYDDVSGVFSGSFTFNDYCSENATFSGDVTFSGVIDTSGSDADLFDSFVFTFYDLTMTSAGASFTLDGELSYSYSGGNPTVALDMYVQDNVSGEVAWIDDYTMLYNGQNVRISGTYYHHEHGRVVISTEQDLYFDSGQEYPSSGILVFEGAPGIEGGNTKVRIEALSSSTCQVTADTDGDGNYDDFDSGQILWTALDD